MKMFQETSLDFTNSFEGARRNSRIAFAIFVIVMVKGILDSGLEIIPGRSPLNRQVSRLFILPVSLIGSVLAIQQIRRAVLGKRKSGTTMLNINLVLSIPILLYIAFSLLFL